MCTGYYLKKEIKPGRFKDVVDEIHRQGGIAAIAHPFVSIGITRKKADVDVFSKVDAVEGFNARCLFKFENRNSQISAKVFDKAITAGSDAHFKFEIFNEPGGDSFLKCFQCGTCTASCPVRVVDSTFNPRRIIRLIKLGAKEKVLTSPFVWMCSASETGRSKTPIVEIGAIYTLSVLGSFPLGGLMAGMLAEFSDAPHATILAAAVVLASVSAVFLTHPTLREVP